MRGTLFRRAKDAAFAIIILLLWSSLGWATTYYVDNTAAGCSRPDSYYDPTSRSCGTGAYQVFYTLQGAADAATEPGDKVIVRSGTYNESVTVKASGTSSLPISFQASGKVVMRGFNLGFNYITIDGFEITGSSDQGIYITGSYNVISNNHIHAMGATSKHGIWTTMDASNCIIASNTIHDVGAVGNAGLRISGHDHIIENNDIGPMYNDVFWIWGTGHLIRDNHIHGIDVIDTQHVDILQTFGNSGRPSNNWVFERNLVEMASHIYGDGYTLQLWNLATNGLSTIHHITIRNNLFVSNSSLWGNSWVPYTYVYNNTFYKIVYTLSFAKEDSNRGDSSGSVIKNNIFYAHSSVPNNRGWYSDGTGPTISGDYNLVYPTKPGFSEDHGINGINPNFVDIGSKNFHLSSVSPARDSGATLIGFSHDKDKVGRPQGTAWDRGAYEYAPEYDSSTPSEPLCAPTDIVEAESGTLVFPMESLPDASLSGGTYITTTALDSGTASYTLNVAETGDYEIRTYAHSADVGSNSFYFSFDGLGEDIWDMFYEGTSFGGWAEDYVSSRGAGTVDSPEADPYVITLTAGTHTLNLRGREIDARLDYFCLVKKETATIAPVAPAPPTGLRIVQVQ